MKISLIAISALFIFTSCSPNSEADDLRMIDPATAQQPDSTATLIEPEVQPVKREVVIEKELTYDKYTLEDTYKYKDTERSFQWDKIKTKLQQVDSLAAIRGKTWGALQNKRNVKGEAPLARDYSRNEYDFIVDAYGVERQQSIPLYLPEDLKVPERYGNDCTLIEFVEQKDDYVVAKTTEFEGEYYIPQKYVRFIEEEPEFKYVVVIDRTNQNIATLERVDDVWKVRSMNPATTGQHKPPHKKETPVGMFLIQNKLPKMYYYSDGTTEIAGYAPWANRFCRGAYIHGVPVQKPATKIIEYSWSLGTTPRSHMCVRNASSHAKFIYDNFPSDHTLVYVIE